MHPVGPHSPGVYWMRRAAVIVVAVLLIVGVAWFVTHRGSGPDVDPAADTTATTTSNRLTGVLATQTTRTTLPGTTGAPTGDTSGAAGDLTGTGAQTGSTGATRQSGTSAKTDAPAKTATTTKTKQDTAAKTKKTKKDTAATKQTGNATKTSASGETGTTAASTQSKNSKKSSKTAKTRTSTPPKPSYDKHGRLICPDSAIDVTVETRSASYPVGAQPVMTLTVKNGGSQPCVRDVSGTLQTFTVYTADGDRVWSTDDCFPGTGHEVYRFQPGESRPFPVTWAGTTSTPGCGTPRVTVEPGKYTVVATLGRLQSKPYPFTMTKG